MRIQHSVENLHGSTAGDIGGNLHRSTSTYFFDLSEALKVLLI